MRGSMSVAVVGAGLAGSACAWRLHQLGHTVSVFDQGRAPGGRASTRRSPDKPGLQFDHGAQFLTARRSETQALIQELQRVGRLHIWEPRLVEVNASQGTVRPRADLSSAGSISGARHGFFDALDPATRLYVGQPSMDSLCSHLTAGPAITLSSGTQVSSVALDPNTCKWRLNGSSTRKPPPGAQPQAQVLGEYDALVMADVLCGRQGSPSFVHAQDPNAQSALGAFQQAATQVSLSRTPLFALMLAYELQSSGSDAGAGGGASAAPQLPFDAACFAGDSRMAWMARDSSKPGRQQGGWDCWVALTTEAYAAELLGADPSSGALPKQDAAYLSQRAAAMLDATRKDLQQAGLTLPEPSFMAAHRWGSAYVTAPLGQPCMHQPEARFAAAGDFCLGAGVENALASGLAAAEALHSAGLTPAL